MMTGEKFNSSLQARNQSHFRIPDCQNQATFTSHRSCLPSGSPANNVKFNDLLRPKFAETKSPALWKLVRALILTH